ncbi:6708_t:CDS:2, partial [Dentiscutata heterogama]
SKTMEDEPWLPEEDSRQLIYEVIMTITRLSRYPEPANQMSNLRRIGFDDAFEGVCSIRDMEIEKQVEQLPTEEIETNIRKLEWNLYRNNASYAEML